MKSRDGIGFAGLRDGAALVQGTFSDEAEIRQLDRLVEECFERDDCKDQTDERGPLASVALTRCDAVCRLPSDVEEYGCALNCLYQII